MGAAAAWSRYPCREDGTAELDDELLLARATEPGRLLFTCDEDLLRITAQWLAAGRDFTGLAHAPRNNQAYRQLIDSLELIARVMESGDVRNQVFHLPL
jgi:hypothetical protein